MSAGAAQRPQYTAAPQTGAYAAAPQTGAYAAAAPTQTSYSGAGAAMGSTTATTYGGYTPQATSGGGAGDYGAAQATGYTTGGYAAAEPVASQPTYATSGVGQLQDAQVTHAPPPHRGSCMRPLWLPELGFAVTFMIITMQL